MLTVACVLKSGGIYDATWVARMRDGVARNLPVEHRFVCLSDVDVPCERIPLEHDWPGWWSKIELFRLDGPVLFFDLDTAIVGDLTDVALAAIDRPFIALRDFYRPDGLGSGILAWDVLFRAKKIYEAFRSDAAAIMRRVGGRGDQGFLEQFLNLSGVMRWQDIIPGQVVSYKAHCRRGQSPVDGRMIEGGIPAGARVVCLHGQPKFAQMPADDPVRLAWEMAA